MPDAIPVPSRQSTAAADMMSLVSLGQADPQPVPGPTSAPPPVQPPPAADPADEAEAAMLTAALGEAGIVSDETDRAAVQALTRLDPDTVATVATWLKARKDKPK